MPPSVVTFANHRGVTPMLWVFCTLAILEMGVVHMFLSLKWPSVAWLLTGLTALTIASLVRWIISWRRLPHELAGETLTLHQGSLRQVILPLSHVAGVSAEVTGDRLRDKGTVNLVPIAFPNRIVELTHASGRRGRTWRYAIRLDDPEHFDTALGAVGIGPKRLETQRAS